MREEKTGRRGGGKRGLWCDAETYALIKVGWIWSIGTRQN